MSFGRGLRARLPRIGAGLGLVGLVAASLQVAACRPRDPDEVARWRGGRLTIAELDAALLAPGGLARFPKDAGAVEDHLRRETRTLFASKILATPEALARLELDPDYRDRWRDLRRARLAKELLILRNAPFEVTLEEAKQRYQARRAQLVQPERRVFRHLYLDAARQQEGEGCRKAEEIRLQVGQGASFEELIQRYSDSADAVFGGRVGPLAAGGLAPALAKVIFAMKPGEASKVFADRSGCHLFQMVEVIPAADPSFELVQHQIVLALAEERRVAWRQGILEKEAAAHGFAVPLWLLEKAPLPEDLKADTLLLELDGEPLLARDLLPLPAGSRLVHAAQQWVGLRLFAKIAEAELPPARLAQIEEEERRDLSWAMLRSEALQAELAGRPESFWREQLANRADRYQTDPEVEAEVFSWPLGQDALAALVRPRAFREQLAGAPDVAAHWRRFAGDAGARRELIPLTSLRQLSRRRPELSYAWAAKLDEGTLTGPFRYENRLYVVRVATLNPARPLSFLEARSGLLQDYLAANRRQVEDAWLDRLALEQGLELAPDAVRDYGRRLADHLAKAPAGPTGPSDPPPSEN